MAAMEKKNISILSCSDFTGGINTAVPPQQLQENEYQVIENFEYDFNRLVTRGGTSAPLVTYDKEILSVFYNNGLNQFLVCLTDGSIWEENLDTLHNQVGTLTGTRKPNYCRFDGKVFIASGGKLQYYDPSAHTVTTVAASYNCDYVWESQSRLVISCMGDDNIYYSATGDPYETGWTEDTDSDSSSKWLEVGYKDDGDILKVLPISGDIATFKSNGKIYDTNGFYTSWNTSLAGDNSDVLTADGIIVLGSTIAFCTNKGLRSLEAVQNYGNFTINELGRKFNRNLEQEVNQPRLYNLVRKRQLIIQPDTKTNTGNLYCLQYDMGACVELSFPLDIKDMADTQDGIIIAGRNSLYRWAKRYTTDNGIPIEQKLVTRQLSSSTSIITRKFDVAVTGSGTLHLKWANKDVLFKVGRKRRVVHCFSVCRDSVLGIETDGNVAIDFINLYAGEN